MKQATDLRRKKELAKIHLAKKALGMDDDTYRAMLSRVAGKESAGDLDQVGRTKVLDHLKASGFSDRPKPPKRAGTRPLAPGAEASKARALWLALYQLGEVRDPSEAGLSAYVKRITSRDALQWCDQNEVAKVINTLRAWADRVGLRAPDVMLINTIDGIRRQHQLERGGAGFAAKMLLLDRLWRQLGGLPNLPATDLFKTAIELDVWLLREFRVTRAWLMSPDLADQAIERLGAAVRQAAWERAQRV
ncbi:gp16 family protein [Dongia deserti]|uniref:gp16 family protein n=1 Tax=Dongia deserti TaxID=2268030 RepID=UPI000E648851|nr:regulatory protein GemA [Dongia deserti]